MTTTSPTRRTTPRGARRLAALAAAAALVLTGCAQSPGTAAVVDGRVISERQLQQARAELDALLPNPVGTSTILVALAVGPFFLDAAAENGVGVSDGDARDLAAQIARQGQAGDLPDAGQAPPEVPDLGPDALEILRFSIASEQLARLPEGPRIISEVEEEVFAADIEVSPRYGDLDPQTGQLVRPQHDWLGAPRP